MYIAFVKVTGQTRNVHYNHQGHRGQTRNVHYSQGHKLEKYITAIKVRGQLEMYITIINVTGQTRNVHYSQGHKLEKYIATIKVTGQTRKIHIKSRSQARKLHYIHQGHMIS